MRSKYHQKPLFAFDWDDVILNTDRVRELVFGLPVLAGVSDQDNRAIFATFKDKVGYNFKTHLKKLVEKYPHLITAVPALQHAFAESLHRDTELVYRDAARFIQRLYGQYDLAIVTTGDPEWQQERISRTGLGPCFNHMLFAPEASEGTPVSKSRIVSRLLEMYPQIFFFEDRVDTLAQVHEEHGRHGRLIPIRVDRKLESTLKYPNIIRHFDEFDLDRWVGLH
jgi:FMN phosphatase YigB (HAD superfamily)